MNNDINVSLFLTSCHMTFSLVVFCPKFVSETFHGPTNVFIIITSLWSFWSMCLPPSGGECFL